MVWRPKPWTGLLIMILLMRSFSVSSLRCHPTEYQIGDECCPMCPAGNRVKTDCTEYRSTSCLPCNEGTFMDRPNGLKKCNPCSTCDSGSGLKLKRKCEPSSDTVCEPMEGFFCIEPTNTGCSAAQRHKSCEELNLRLITAGTAAADAQCGEKSFIGIVVWITLGILVFLLVICILGFLYCRRSGKLQSFQEQAGKKRNQNKSKETANGPEEEEKLSGNNKMFFILMTELQHLMSQQISSCFITFSLISLHSSRNQPSLNSGLIFIHCKNNVVQDRHVQLDAAILFLQRTENCVFHEASFFTSG
ncbi:tumor necrosis factor receptor superfamily member 6-like isoform X2 [Kryptolebias marmoratus]|uniref:tumor necrosis factor receptor superfamily member 6-like isoform X2 n=1 Tax=Kryptolebias marmoratus TaxID=37003 RepID=UPI0018AD0A9A|nr:tumor necrosis factor receptor superfamily member 6-like isoform X2 [Kryptolebias marmoratus]